VLEPEHRLDPWNSYKSAIEPEKQEKHRKIQRLLLGRNGRVVTEPRIAKFLPDRGLPSPPNQFLGPVHDSSR